MKTFNNEQFLLEIYRTIPTYKIQYLGRFFSCLKIELLTKSVFFSKSWIDSSAKDMLPPDFHNNKHKIMMEVMRIDDCVNKINKKHVCSSFERAKMVEKSILGDNYKNKNGMLFVVPDTTNSDEFNFKGYMKNFERVVLKHASKVEKYKENYPNCKTTVFLICDETNNYIQVNCIDDLSKENEKNVVLENFKIHYHFMDSYFIDIIKKSNADFVIWWGYGKSIFVNGKHIKSPQICIYDVKHFKETGFKYDHNLMFKVKQELSF